MSIFITFPKAQRVYASTVPQSDIPTRVSDSQIKFLSWIVKSGHFIEDIDKLQNIVHTQYYYDSEKSYLNSLRREHLMEYTQYI